MRLASASRKFIRLTLIVIAKSSPVSLGFAQEKTPFPTYTGERVYVSGVPDQFNALRSQIAGLEQSSPQTYYVVVVQSFGRGSSADRDYVDDLYHAWRREASDRRLPLDSERSVIVATALGDHKVLIRPGTVLREKFGWKGATIERELIRPTFVPLARQEKYSEAISALLNGINNWIAAKDRATAKVAAGALTQVTEATPRAPSAPSHATTAAPGSIAGADRDRSSGSSLGTIVGLVVLGLVVVAVVLLWLAHRASRSRVNRLIKEFRTRSVAVMDRLDALKERLKLLPKEDPDFREPMGGETLALYNTVQAKLGELWDRWLQLMESLDKAQKLAAATATPLDQNKLQQAENLLDPKEAFREIETQAEACAAELDHLNRAHETAQQALEAVSASQSKLASQLDAARKLDLPTVAYHEDLEAIQTGFAQAKGGLTADPIGTQTALVPLASRAEKLLDRVGRVVILCGEAEQVRGTLESVKQNAADCRAQGLALAEQGGNPDHYLGKAAQNHSECLTALRAGDPEVAAQKLDAARALIQQGTATIEEVKKARSNCQLQETARARETERLRAALPEVETYHRQLESEFAPASWQAVARNLEQARTLLASFDRLAADAASAASSTAQKYLEGARIYEQLAQQQQIVLRLMSGLREQRDALVAARNDCQQARGELDRQVREVDDYLRGHAASVGDMARNSFAAAVQAKDDALAQFGAPRPDWPATRQSLARVTEELAIARSQAETDLRAHEQLKQEFARARQTADRVYALLVGHEEDRLAANQHYQAAADALDQVGVDLNAPRGESARLLDQVRGAAADLEQAERMAREDIRLAAQAQAELVESTRTIRQARAYFSLGVTVDTSRAEATLEQANQLLQSQEYEQAIEHAGIAMRAVRQAHQQAVQQAQWRQMQNDAELRRRNMGSAGGPGEGVGIGTAIAATAAGIILDQLNKAGASTSPPLPIESPAEAPMPVATRNDADDAAGSWSVEDDARGNW